jgi:hypothetical protein
MVSEKDIRAHEGLVRCGNCYSVFNSSWNLTDDPRKDIVDEPVSTSTANETPARGTGFTFSILDKDAAVAGVTDTTAEESSEENVETEAQTSSTIDEEGHGTQSDDLEPFPEPEMEHDFHTITPLPDKHESSDSLLYFGSDTEEDDINPVADTPEPVSIEDLTILQAPSFSIEPRSLDSDAPSQEHLIDDSDSSLKPMTEESMWPGSEVSFSKVENDIELPVLEVHDSKAETEISEKDENLPELSDVLVDEAVAEEPVLDASQIDEQQSTASLDMDPLSDQYLTSEIILNEAPEDEELENGLSHAINIEEPLVDEGEIESAIFESELPESLSTTSEEENDVAAAEPHDDNIHQAISDSTFSKPSEQEEIDDEMFIESLAESVDEAFDLDIDEEEKSVPDSVFITSEEEDIDEAYIPISMKPGEKKELFNQLDEFPEPGELSELNYEDTMQINAMIEAANISKEQIESALTAATIDDSENEDENHDDIAEEIVLGSDVEKDMPETLLSAIMEEDDEQPEDESQIKEKKSGILNLKNLLPAGLGGEKTNKSQAVTGSEETQLARSLNRGGNKLGLPEWITKYSPMAASVLLILTLLGQIGYFYMDKLVHITPLRPVLEAGCKVAGCKVPTIQDIGNIEQLSSRLTPHADRDGELKVTSILVNRSTRPQVFPALELTLMDRAGNLISRRVVTQDKYLIEGQAKEMKPNEAVDINIRFQTPSIRVDGFELRPVSQNWLERSN